MSSLVMAHNRRQRPVITDEDDDTPDLLLRNTASDLGRRREKPKWSCLVCTYDNKPKAKRCKICLTKRGQTMSNSHRQHDLSENIQRPPGTYDHRRDVEGGGGGGGSFRPRRHGQKPLPLVNNHSVASDIGPGSRRENRRRSASNGNRRRDPYSNYNQYPSPPLLVSASNRSNGSSNSSSHRRSQTAVPRSQSTRNRNRNRDRNHNRNRDVDRSQSIRSRSRSAKPKPPPRRSNRSQKQKSRRRRQHEHQQVQEQEQDDYVIDSVDEFQGLQEHSKSLPPAATASDYYDPSNYLSSSHAQHNGNHHQRRRQQKQQQQQHSKPNKMSKSKSNQRTRPMSARRGPVSPQGIAVGVSAPIHRSENGDYDHEYDVPPVPKRKPPTAPLRGTSKSMHTGNVNVNGRKRKKQSKSNGRQPARHRAETSPEFKPQHPGGRGHRPLPATPTHIDIKANGNLNGRYQNANANANGHGVYQLRSSQSFNPHQQQQQGGTAPPPRSNKSAKRRRKQNHNNHPPQSMKPNSTQPAIIASLSSPHQGYENELAPPQSVTTPASPMRGNSESPRPQSSHSYHNNRHPHHRRMHHHGSDPNLCRFFPPSFNPASYKQHNGFGGGVMMPFDEQNSAELDSMGSYSYHSTSYSLRNTFRDKIVGKLNVESEYGPNSPRFKTRFNNHSAEQYQHDMEWDLDPLDMQFKGGGGGGRYEYDDHENINPNHNHNRMVYDSRSDLDDYEVPIDLDDKDTFESEINELLNRAHGDNLNGGGIQNLNGHRIRDEDEKSLVSVNSANFNKVIDKEQHRENCYRLSIPTPTMTDPSVHSMPTTSTFLTTPIPNSSSIYPYDCLPPNSNTFEVMSGVLTTTMEDSVLEHSF